MRAAFLLILLAPLLAATAARAEVGVFVEDFSDALGQPAFDPLFNHSCAVDDPEGKKWYIGTYTPGHALLLAVFSNTITFNIAPDEYVFKAGVESRTGANSAKFVGAQGVLEYVADQWPYQGPDFWEATSDQIGPITSIELRAGQGWFDNVTIHVGVIPEPSALALAASGLALWLASIIRRRRRAVP